MHGQVATALCCGIILCAMLEGMAKRPVYIYTRTCGKAEWLFVVFNLLASVKECITKPLLLIPLGSSAVYNSDL